MTKKTGPVKGLEYVGDIISFPPVETNYFNPNGEDLFRSKIQIILLIPTVLIVGFIVFNEIYLAN